ncbi:DUF3368 domain-containing protein [Persicitalea sp.]|uniref:DUF3368 domain-containing protein n=1 Tax=Persicitalea sp. TaxID=3100273 RepID=UPI003592FD5A
MPEQVLIADTSCFIVLVKVNELELLHKVYGEVTTTTDIAIEFGAVLPDWVTVKRVMNSDKQQAIEKQIDRGEASAIALALESPNSTVVLDDYKARKLAKSLGVRVTGTIGVIMRAKSKGIFSVIKPILEKIKETDFRLSEEIESQALRDVGE